LQIGSYSSSIPIIERCHPEQKANQGQYCADTHYANREKASGTITDGETGDKEQDSGHEDDGS
jgi:hypothetical protein